MQLQNTSGMSREQFAAARDRLLAAANRTRICAGPSQRVPDVASLKVDIDVPRLTALGLTRPM